MRPDRGIVGGRGHDGVVTTTERADTTLRPRAEEVLRGLAGPTARLRDDQWTAIHALVVAEPRGRPREPAQHFFGTGAQRGVGTLGRRHHTIVTPTPDNSAIGAHP